MVEIASDRLNQVYSDYCVWADQQDWTDSVPQNFEASPSRLYPDLYKDHLLGDIFPDFKTFVDAVPRVPASQINEAYAHGTPFSAEALKLFVAVHFEFSNDVSCEPKVGEDEPLAKHIAQLWNPLTKGARHVEPGSTLLPLPHPYVVPGGRFQELYYWDSYFTMLGFGPDEAALQHGMVENFAHMISVYGHIPNANRRYYLSRSQPPFFFKMVGMLSPDDEAASFAKYLPELKREYAYWMRGASGLLAGQSNHHVVALPDGALLNRYWDACDTPRDESLPHDVSVADVAGREAREVYRDIRAGAESGWDYSSRWFADGLTMTTIETTSIIPIDLNSLLYGLERAISAGSERLGDNVCADLFARLATRRCNAVDTYLWNEVDGRYDDYQWQRGQRKDQLTAATLFPLFVHLANPEQARRVALVVKKHLLKDGGLVTTTCETGQQWDAPNGWAPLQWIAVDGLRHYSEHGLAADIARRWLAVVGGFFAANGRLLEKYDVVTVGREGGGGEYALQDGFGWTNGVTQKLSALYPQVDRPMD